jgi:hypothetical protein
MWYSWARSGAIGYQLFVAYMLVVEIGKWIVRWKIEKAIKRTYRTGKIIHGPDDV